MGKGRDRGETTGGHGGGGSNGKRLVADRRAHASGGCGKGSDAAAAGQTGAGEGAVAVAAAGSPFAATRPRVPPPARGRAGTRRAVAVWDGEPVTAAAVPVGRRWVRDEARGGLHERLGGGGVRERLELLGAPPSRLVPARSAVTSTQSRGGVAGGADQNPPSPSIISVIRYNNICILFHWFYKLLMHWF